MPLESQVPEEQSVQSQYVRPSELGHAIGVMAQLNVTVPGPLELGWTAPFVTVGGVAVA